MGAGGRDVGSFGTGEGEGENQINIRTLHHGGTEEEEGSGHD